MVQGQDVPESSTPGPLPLLQKAWTVPPDLASPSRYVPVQLTALGTTTPMSLQGVGAMRCSTSPPGATRNCVAPEPARLEAPWKASPPYHHQHFPGRVLSRAPGSSQGHRDWRLEGPDVPLGPSFRRKRLPSAIALSPLHAPAPVPGTLYGASTTTMAAATLLRDAPFQR